MQAQWPAGRRAGGMMQVQTQRWWRHGHPDLRAPTPPSLPPQELATFGFRGEALSSLCAVADVSVVTRTVEQDVGVRLRWALQH